MVEFDIKMHERARIAYIPKKIAEILGPNIKASANCVAVLMYPGNTKPADVLRSLEIIAMDLRHKIELQNSAVAK